MKGFLATLFVVCGIIAAAWYFYDPYIKDLVEGKDEMMKPNDTVITDSSGAKAKPAASTTTAASPETEATTAPKPAAKPKSEIDLLLEEKYPMPEIIPLMEIVGNWANVPDRAFPEQITAQEPVAFQLVVNGQAVGSSNVPAGTPLKPTRLVGNQLTVANLANPAQGVQIDVDKTDFKKRITDRYNEFVSRKEAEVDLQREKAREVLEANPEKLAILKGEKPAETNFDGDPRVAPVKASLKAGEVATVTLEEARSFVWNGTEKVYGDYPGTYETVTVHFEVKTIFGKFPVDYKALLQNGKVIAWIDPMTDERV